MGPAALPPHAARHLFAVHHLAERGLQEAILPGVVLLLKVGKVVE
jgi:hypothetical protein